MDFTINPQTKEFITKLDATPELKELIFKHIENAFIEGYHKGFHKGYEDGHLDGYNSGYEDGHYAGYYEGIDNADRFW